MEMSLGCKSCLLTAYSIIPASQATGEALIADARWVFERLSVGRGKLCRIGPYSAIQQAVQAVLSHLL
jgi:hypothetical protein